MNNNIDQEDYFHWELRQRREFREAEERSARWQIVIAIATVITAFAIAILF